MPDSEKVVKSLKWFRDREKWREGIMIHDDHAEVRKQICDNAIELLKEQEHKDKMFRALEEDWKRLKEEQEAMNECLKRKCVICPHCENCDVDENGLLKEQEAVRPQDAEMLIIHNGGAEEYVEDIESIVLLAHKDYDIVYCGRFSEGR